jgi:hypothetical protein
LGLDRLAVRSIESPVQWVQREWSKVAGL